MPKGIGYKFGTHDRIFGSIKTEISIIIKKRIFFNPLISILPLYSFSSLREEKFLESIT